jgi:hypothetical protein
VSFVHKFMNATGKLRAVFGPANKSALNQELLKKRQAETQQWETLRRPDGSTYVVPKNPDDQSLR